MNEQAVRERAYELWEKEGCPDGREPEFWERARLMLDAEAAPPPVTSTPLPGTTDDQDAAVAQSFPASDPASSTVSSGAKTGRR